MIVEPHWLLLFGGMSFWMGAWVGSTYERRRLGPTRATPPFKEEQAARQQTIRSMIEYRAAVHEAGHAVCVWFCPYASQLKRITIDDGSIGEGRVEYHYTASNRPGAHWYQAVVHLGGIAAEMHEFGRLRSGPSRIDLARAKDKAQQIVEADKLMPPWGAVELAEGHFDVAQMYRSIDSGSATALVLNLAYQRARYLVDKDHERLVRVAEGLAEHGVLEELDIRRIFGRRPMMRWFG